MFNQQEYVNRFIKDHYRTFKVRVDKTDRVVLERLAKEENVNQYLLALIRADIQSQRTYPFIDPSVIIDFPLSKTMQELVQEAERADILEDYGLYMNLSDAIDSQAKKETAHHLMSESQWKALMRRYHQ